MNNSQIRIQKASRLASIFTRIIYVVLIITICAELVGIVWVIISPDSNTLMLGNIRVISPVRFSGFDGQGATLNDLIRVVLSQIFAIPVLILTYRIFKDISRDYTPFSMKHIKRMKTIALILFINSFFVPSAEAVAGILIPDLDFSSGMSLYMIVGAILFYFLALIFEYGASLQQLSDETL